MTEIMDSGSKSQEEAGQTVIMPFPTANFSAEASQGRRPDPESFVTQRGNAPPRESVDPPRDVPLMIAQLAENGMTPPRPRRPSATNIEGAGEWVPESLHRSMPGADEMVAITMVAAETVACGSREISDAVRRYSEATSALVNVLATARTPEERLEAQELWARETTEAMLGCVMGLSRAGMQACRAITERFACMPDATNMDTMAPVM
ncbi:hypothetical protein [Sphingomonas oleivorans]|nr:hypothetical protein [Sphingomonas oleivorans]